MAKYFGSPLGVISGKLGDLVFFYSKGRSLIRTQPRHPKDNFSFKVVRKAIRGTISWDEVNIKCVNTEFVFGTLSYLYTKRLKPFIGPIWEKICKLKRNRIMAQDLFIKYNFSSLYFSIPEPNKLCLYSNIPDFTQLLISDNGLNEFTSITNISYNPHSGELSIGWGTFCYLDGKLTDEAYIVIFYWAFPELKFDLTPWASIKLWEFTANREDGKMIMKVDKGLNPKYLIAFLFFESQGIYSKSASSRASKL
ncbi:hypothetical protein KAW65_07660 [candidate division WOR-3 bacterium]|nr:hypothetical protein [candidate division WOR-3 bacterium]